MPGGFPLSVCQSLSPAIHNDRTDDDKMMTMMTAVAMMMMAAAVAMMAMMMMMMTKTIHTAAHVHYEHVYLL